MVPGQAGGDRLGQGLQLDSSFRVATRAEPRPRAQARSAIGPITIDGRLDEAAWEKAETLVLTQQSPRSWQPSPYPTEVKVLVYKDALVFGFHCHDPDPRQIQNHTLTRDGTQFGDDTVTVILDTFGDRRTAYYFQINEAGARLDGLISGAANFSTDWDGIWNARTARTADGWSAEIWIPAQTMNFARHTVRWGLQLDRSIVRDQTELRWSSPTYDSDIYDMSRAGELEVVESLAQGHGLEFAPYTAGKMLRNFPAQSRNWMGTGGGEVTWRITPQLAGIVSVNTDFAETEVDSRQINVTPFPLYFPEKRAFFLEGANQYSFGLELESTSNTAVTYTTTFIPFFSRNVGLLDGYDIPLDGGAKLNGHVGKLSIGFLDAQTRQTYVPQTVVDALGLSSAKVEGTNLLASRLAYDFDKHLRIGTIVTHGDPEAKLSNTLVATDAQWITSTFMRNRNLRLGGWAGTTQGEVPIGNRQAWGLRFLYPNDLMNCTAGTNRFNDGFDPLLSFLPRPGTHQVDASCTLGPRPDQKGPFRGIRQAFYDLGYTRITDTKGNLQSEQYLVDPLRLTSNAGDSLIVQALVRHETLSSPFTIFPGVTYPAKGYDFQRYGVTVQTSPQRPLQFLNESYVGSYYGGHLYHQINNLNWTPFRGRLEAGVTADNYFSHSPQGNFVEKLWQFKGAVSWSPDLSLSTFVQYDNVSFGLSSNTRLRWTFRPGDDFFLIWDRTWVRDASRTGINVGPEAESLTAKIRWTFRL